MSQELIIVIALALVFDFLNGLRDASNIVATMISSRAFSPETALGIAAVAEFFGPFLFGVPVSASQVVSSAIIGVGSAERASKVRWSVAEDIVMSWLITIPASGLLAAGVYWLIGHLGR